MEKRRSSRSFNGNPRLAATRSLRSGARAIARAPLRRLRVAANRGLPLKLLEDLRFSILEPHRYDQLRLAFAGADLRRRIRFNVHLQVTDLEPAVLERHDLAASRGAE